MAALTACALALADAAAAAAVQPQRGATPILGWNNCQIDCGPWAPDDELVHRLHAAFPDELRGYHVVLVPKDAESPQRR